MKKQITLLLTFLTVTQFSFGQYHISNAKFIRWNKTKTIPLFIQFDLTNAPVKGNASIQKIRAVFNINKNTRLKQYQVLNDNIGFQHIRYQLYYQNIPIEGSVLIAHYYEQKLHSINGEFYGNFTQNYEPKLSEEKAFSVALEYCNASKFMWQIPEEEAMIKQIDEDENATYFPKAELYYTSDGRSFNAQDFTLCYRLDIYSHTPHSRRYIFVNAHTGEIIKEQDLIHTGDVKGSAKTRYSGTQSITTDSVSATRYRLRQKTDGKGIETYNMKQGSSYGASVDFIDSDNNWTTFNTNQDEIATDAHWGAEKTYQYFWKIHGRKSFDNKNAKIKSYVHRGVKYNNAFWNGKVMTYGDGDGKRFTPLTCIDVCGHEVSHAVTSYSANLVYAYESGALNESFSDIFGNLIERYARPSQYSYKIGEDITPSGNGLRNMSNPNLRGHPDTYKGNKWRTGPGDKGGVHSNSGVQNYWFYLLSEGKKDKNDNNDSFDVQGIGHQKAAKIAYRNLTTYLTRNSQYKDARFYAIRAAIDLYGDCSNELKQTTNAWHAVGVGEKYDTNAHADFYANPTLVCFTSDTIQFFNGSYNASAFKWYFGDGDSSTLREPKHAYPTYDSFTVKLVVSNCSGTTNDTLIRKKYIVVDSSRIVCKSDFMPLFGNGDTITKCRGYLMDNGKDKNYITRRTTYQTIAPVNAKKVNIHFLEFAMENKFDSLYIYDGKSITAPLLGGFTGFSLPPDLVANSGAVTIKHFADPFKVFSGFVLKWTTEKDSLTIIPPSDTTICVGNELVLTANYKNGGNEDAMEWLWTDKNTVVDTFKFSPTKDTTVRVIIKDNCMSTADTAFVKIKVLQPLKLTTTPDTTICFGQIFELKAKGQFGDTINYLYTWNNGLKPGKTNFIMGKQDTSFRVILSDGCSIQNDTNYIKITVRDSLSLSINNDTTICQGNSVNLLGNAKGGNGNFVFNWDNGLGNGKTQMVSPLKTTTYICVLSDGCTSPTQFKTVTITVLDSLKLDLQKDTTICQGNTVILNGVASGGNYKYRYAWKSLSGNTNLQSVSPKITTKFILTLNDGCSALPATDSVTVQVKSPLKVDVNNDTTVCYGAIINLDASGNGGDLSRYNFQWDNGLGLGNSKNISLTNTTKYRVILSDGCTPKSDTNYVTINVLPALDFTKTQDSTICIGESLTISVNGTGGKSNKHQFSWDNGLGVGTSFKVSPMVSTNYKITLNDGCSNPITKTILINVNAKPNVKFDANKHKICAGDSIQFSNNTQGVNANFYNWSFGDGNSSNIENPLQSFNKAGIFDISLYLKNNNGCEGKAIKTQLIEVIEKPIAIFTFLPKEPDITNNLITFSNTSTGATMYKWIFGNGNTSTGKDPIITYTDTGFYTVKLVVSNTLGCTDTLIKNVYVKDVFNLYKATAFSPNGDGINEKFNLVGRGIETLEMRIYSRWGEELFHTNNKNIGWNGEITNTGIIAPAGTYIYLVTILDVNGLRRNIKGTVDLLR